MKLPFPIPDDTVCHTFCISCYQDGVRTVRKGDTTSYICSHCGTENQRRIVTGGMKLWVDEQGEIRHESAGIFVRRADGAYLFFELTAFPYGYTVPAGHVDTGETGEQAAIRELGEEVGIAADDVKEFASCTIPGDRCSSGADTHDWHAFVYQLKDGQAPTRCEEGKNLQWLTIEQAREKRLPPAIAHLIEHCCDKL